MSEGFKTVDVMRVIDQHLHPTSSKLSRPGLSDALLWKLVSACTMVLVSKSRAFAKPTTPRPLEMLWSAAPFIVQGMSLIANRDATPSASFSEALQSNGMLFVLGPSDGYHKPSRLTRCS